MKYIKLYESFEIEEIKDCFLDIIDDGFEVDISNVDKNTSGNDKTIYISISKIISGLVRFFTIKKLRSVYCLQYLIYKRSINFQILVCVYINMVLGQLQMLI